MNISHSEVINLESVLTVTVEQNYLTQKTESILKDYRKKVEIPGFRKGTAPMNFIKKKYESAIKFEEINKILNESVSKYIQENELDLIGNAIPLPKEEFDLDGDEITFDFRLGFKPNLNIDLSKYDIPFYQIKASEKSIDEALENILNQFSTSESQEEINEESNIQIDLIFSDEEKPKKPILVQLEMLKDSALLIGKKIGDKIDTSSDNFLKDPERTKNLIGSEDQNTVENFTIEIKGIEKFIKPELNEELFKKAYPENEIKSIEELRVRLAEEIENYYKESSKIYFYNKATEKLLETIECPLPENFLIETIKSNGEKDIPLEEAQAEFEKSKKGYQYYLIENQIIKDNNIQPSYPELMDFIRESIKKQLISYGMANIEDEQLENFVQYSIKDKKQLEKYSEELLRSKLINIFQEKINKTNTEIQVEDFLELIK